MSRESDTEIGLAEYLAALQSELSKTHELRARDDLRFAVDAVTVELDISYTLTPSTESPTRVKPQFWMNAPADKKPQDSTGSRSRHMQHVSVRLTPRPEIDLDVSKATATPSLRPNWPNVEMD